MTVAICARCKHVNDDNPDPTFWKCMAHAKLDFVTGDETGHFYCATKNDDGLCSKYTPAPAWVHLPKEKA